MKGNIIKHVWLFGVVLALSACGGGGSGSSKSSTSSTSSSSASSSNSSSTSSSTSSTGGIEFQLSPSAINEQGVAGEVSIMMVTGTASAELGVSTLYLGADADPDVFRSITFYQDTDSITAQIETHEDLWGGTYTGDITVYVCEDANCNTHLANSPLTLPYTITMPKSYNRMEPVNYSNSTVVDYDRDFIAINAESGTTGVSVEYRTEFSDNAGQLVFPDDMLEQFTISNASADGFTLTTPTLADGTYKFDYKLELSHSTTTRDLTIYYMVGREGGSQDQFVFFEDPIVINALYGSPNNYYSSPYVVFGKDRDLLDQEQFSINYIDGANWVDSLNPTENLLTIDLATENLALGTYTATIDATTFYTQISGHVELIVNVVHGFDVFNQFDQHTFNDYFFREQSYTAYVDNSLQAQGTWTATSPDSWIQIDTPTGEFPTQEQRDNYDSSPLHYSFNPQGLADLPNNSEGTGEIIISSTDNLFPDATIELDYEKRIPQITQLSQVEVVAGQPFSITAEGLNLYSAEHHGVGLRVAQDPYLFEYFSVSTLADGTEEGALSLSHSGITNPGIYEVVIDHNTNREFEYGVAFVPRVTLTVVAAE